MKKITPARKTFPNYNNALKSLMTILELIGKPYLLLFKLLSRLPKKITYTTLRFLIFVGEFTTSIILFPLKLTLSLVKKLQKIAVLGSKISLKPIQHSLTLDINKLKSLKVTLPHAPSVNVELHLSKILFKAAFWPCYFVGRLTYELVLFPFIVIKKVSNNSRTIIFSCFQRIKNIKITRPKFPNIKVSKPVVLSQSISKQSKKHPKKFGLSLKEIKKALLKKLKVFRKTLSKKLTSFIIDNKKAIKKQVLLLAASIIRIPKSIALRLKNFLTNIGGAAINVFKLPYSVLLFLTSAKTKKKQKKALRQKYLSVQARFRLFLKELNNALKHPLKSPRKKLRNNIRSVGLFLSSNNDPLLRPFLFFLRTPRRALATLLVVIGLMGSFYNAFLKDLPSPYDLVRQKQAVSSRIFDRNGKLLFTIFNGNENRTIVRLSELPPFVYEASIAIEDKDFYKHHGLSIKGIIRAAERNLLHTNVVEGGSTITQQLVKNALLSNERTMKRKIRELILAFGTEMIFSKNEILEMYLNEVSYGGPTYGIQEAARLYFGKQARDLTLAEASLLAGLPAAPSAYSPYGLNKDYAKSRQLSVLKNMVSEGYINQSDADKAYKEDLAYSPNLIAIKAPHFVMWVRDLLNQKYGRQLVEEGGLDIYTTLDLDIQEKAEQIVKDNVDKLEKPYWISNAAALVTDPRKGEVLAMVGSRDFFDLNHDGNVNVTIMPRQPGSSIKAVNYAYALGHGMTPTTIISDSPVTYRNAWESYTPVNYDGKYRGNVTLRAALAMSLNIPAVKVLNSYGPDKMVDLGVKMGIRSWKNLKNYGLSLTLGAGEVPMTELATAYGTIANYGKRVDLNPIKKIVNYQGMVLEDIDIGLTKNSLVTEAYAKSEETPQSDPVISPFVAYQLIDILSDNKARLPAFGPYSKLEIPGYKIAVKTGTTDNKRDNWTIGFTTNRLVATWVGNNNNRPMNPSLASGITGAAPIWNEIMTQVVQNEEPQDFPRPEGMKEVEVCEANGLLPCDRCPKVVKQYFVPGQEPTKKCYFPSPAECQAKKDAMEKEGKKPEEIVAALAGCSLTPAPSPKP